MRWDGIKTETEHSPQPYASGSEGGARKGFRPSCAADSSAGGVAVNLVHQSFLLQLPTTAGLQPPGCRLDTGSFHGDDFAGG
jgi:hypothetical protein